MRHLLYLKGIRNLLRMLSLSLFLSLSLSVGSQRSTLIEENVGDPDLPKNQAETLTLDAAKQKNLQDRLNTNTKGAVVDSREVAFKTVDIAKLYAGKVSRSETPATVTKFLKLYDLPFEYSPGSYVPYCASGVGFAACRAHHILAYLKKHPGDNGNADSGDNVSELYDSLGDVRRDYCRTHPACSIMVADAQKRHHGNGEAFWVSRSKEPKVEPQHGWLVFYNWNRGSNPQHVGIVDSFSGGMVHTVEFNTSKKNQSNGGRVELRDRELTHVIGYIRTYPSPPPPKRSK